MSNGEAAVRPPLADEIDERRKKMSGSFCRKTAFAEAVIMGSVAACMEDDRPALGVRP